MGTGYLKVQLSAADGAIPVVGALVKILDMQNNLLTTLITDQSGITDQLALEAPDVSTQFDPNSPIRPYSRYIVDITADGFHETISNGIQIYDQMGSTLPLSLNPILPGEVNPIDEYDIGENALEMANTHQDVPPPFDINARIHREVFIPTHIRVHLGRPAANARIITVPFVDYIKNVASSEIYPNWPYHSLRANIHAQISLVLNRVFTEWYRGKGYNFDITNSTQYDQYFVEGRNIYDSVSAIANEIFNTYINKPPGIEPFFAEYCSGTTATCRGMSQWGTVTLANQGRDYLAILRYYYGNTITVRTTNNIQTPFESFQGNLSLGSTGQNVALMQSMLARIRRNYPLIPNLSVDGSYGSQTVAAVRTFQQIFGLPQTGTIDRRTWYQISNIFNAVAKLGELGTEGFVPPSITPPPPPPPSINPPYPGTLLRVGSRGQSVTTMQTFLNSISSSYPSIPRQVVDGIFGSAMQNAVMAFQRQFGLNADGIIGPQTWNRIVEVYNSSGGTVVPPPTAPQYPGTPIRLGSRGANVVTVQNYLNRASATIPSIPRLVADGIFGPLTQSAVMAFQRATGLTADGVVGPLTWNRLVRY